MNIAIPGETRIIPNQAADKFWQTPARELNHKEDSFGRLEPFIINTFNTLTGRGNFVNYLFDFLVFGEYFSKAIK